MSAGAVLNYSKHNDGLNLSCFCRSSERKLKKVEPGMRPHRPERCDGKFTRGILSGAVEDLVQSDVSIKRTRKRITRKTQFLTSWRTAAASV